MWNWEFEIEVLCVTNEGHKFRIKDKIKNTNSKDLLVKVFTLQKPKYKTAAKCFKIKIEQKQFSKKKKLYKN